MISFVTSKSPSIHPSYDCTYMYPRQYAALQLGHEGWLAHKRVPLHGGEGRKGGSVCVEEEEEEEEEGRGEDM